MLRENTRQSGKLVIVESPTKAKTIKKILGRGFTVKATVGHIRDLDTRRNGKNSFGVDIENGFEPQYIIIPGKKKTVAELKTAAERASEIYLAPDPDREGEAIAWHIKTALSLSDKQAKRISYQSVTKKAITDALNNPRDIDMNLVSAQISRRVLDRIVGFSLSPFLWKKVAKNLSAGRVQSVAVRLVVEKERAIRAFIPREYWRIDALLHAKSGDDKPFSATLVSWKGNKFALGGKYSSSETAAREVETTLKTADYVVSDVISKETFSRPQPPFITSTLQQAASGQLHFGTSRTMRIAQSLYEGVEIDGSAVGLITYMRTDSIRMDPSAISEIRDWIGNNQPNCLPDSPRYYGNKSTGKIQDAHEAIRPTSVLRTPDSVKPYLKPEQYKIYELIWRRAVSSQMKDAQYSVTTIVAKAADGVLEARGRVLLFPGFTVLVPETKKTDLEFQELPSLKTGTALALDELTTEQKWTKPPARYTEASLVRTLEKEGIGRPSTYATIVKTIRDRGYVRLEKRYFFANELGMAVNDILLTEFPSIMDYRFTAEMEKDLDSIEEGSIDWFKLLDDFYRDFSKRVNEAVEKAEPLKGRLWTGCETCPICGKSLVVKYSKSGAFLGCSDYPNCKGTVPLPGEGHDDGETNGDPVNCPQCNKIMLIKSSRFGQFYACSDYPDCKTRVSIGADGKPIFMPKIDMDCDECATAMEVKSKRRGPTMVCPNPDCKRELPIRDGKVITLPKANGSKCEKCGSPMIVRLSRRGPFLACSNFPNCRNAKSIDG